MPRTVRAARRLAARDHAPITSRGTRERPFLFEAVWYAPETGSVHHHALIDVNARTLGEAEQKAYAVLLMHGKATRVLGHPVTLRAVGTRHRWADGYRAGKAPILRASPHLNPLGGWLLGLGAAAAVIGIAYYAAQKIEAEVAAALPSNAGAGGASSGSGTTPKAA